MTYDPYRSQQGGGSSEYDPFRSSAASGYDPYAGRQSGPPQGPPRPNTSVAMWSYLGPLLVWLLSFLFMPFLVWFAWVIPLVLRNGQTARQDPFTRRHAIQALNATLTDVIIALPLLILIFAAFFGGLISGSSDDGGSGTAVGTVFGVLLAVALLLAGIAYTIARIAFLIIACTKANGGEDYVIPSWIAFRMVKDQNPPEAAAAP